MARPGKVGTMILRGHKVYGGQVEGVALVVDEPFSFFGGVNPETGILTSGPCAGQTIRDKIFIFPRGKGSTLAPYVAYRALGAGAGPRALVCREVDGVVAMVSIIMGIPTVDRLAPDPIETIRSGDYLKVDAENGCVEIITRG